MGIQITFNTDDLTAEDRNVLNVLLGGSPTPAPAAASPSAAKAPAKKAAAPKPAPVPDPEPEEDDSDLLGGDTYTMGDAVARATELVGAGEAARVKAALADLGVKKVSELKSDEDINTFVTTLQD